MCIGHLLLATRAGLGAATVKDLSPSVTLVLPLDDANNIPADDIKVIPLKMTYYLDFPQTWHN